MITISLCMIVKNEEAVLERLLRTMSTVADQIVIMDTGSTDRTKEIAARYTDEVYDFPRRIPLHLTDMSISSAWLPSG